MKLYIDSSNNLKTVIKLDNTTYTQSYTNPRQQNVLGAIVEALNQSNRHVTDITQIEVKPGPGSFTGLRVGHSIANALGFALQIPVNGADIGSTNLPKYGQAPTITPRKST